MVHFVEINQALSHNSMLQHIGRIGTPNLVPRNCLGYLQKTLIMGGGRFVSEFMCTIVEERLLKKYYVIKYLILPKIPDIMDIKKV